MGIYCSGHVGFGGNKRADNLSFEASTNSTLTIVTTNVLRTIRDNLMKIEIISDEITRFRHMK